MRPEIFENFAADGFSGRKEDKMYAQTEPFLYNGGALSLKESAAGIYGSL